MKTNHHLGDCLLHYNKLVHRRKDEGVAKALALDRSFCVVYSYGLRFLGK